PRACASPPTLGGAMRRCWRPAAAASRPAPRRGEGQGARAAQLVDSIRSGSLRQWEVAKSVEAKAALGELGDLKECTRAISALGAEGLWESAVGLLQEMRLRPDGAPDAVAWSAAITACEKAALRMLVRRNG
ncbi:unnamed protein product, partial [Prorocentrum cordatum]